MAKKNTVKYQIQEALSWEEEDAQEEALQADANYLILDIEVVRKMTPKERQRQIELARSEDDGQ